MKRMITVAAVQMEIMPLDIGRNLAKIEKLVGELCNQQPVDLVVLPEDVLTGPIPYNLEYALSESSSEVTRLCQIAREKQLYLAAGSFICKDGNNYYNTALLIDPSGEINFGTGKIIYGFLNVDIWCQGMKPWLLIRRLVKLVWQSVGI